jgi:transposase
MEPEGTYIGIDIAKDHLDVAVRPTGEQWRSPNSEAGIAQVMMALHALAPTLVVLEATEGWNGLWSLPWASLGCQYR